MPNDQVVRYTTKQMGDACEMLIAAELTLAGVPALRVPDLWPDYDIIAQPKGADPQRIQVKSRTYKPGGGAFVTYDVNKIFDWLAIVLLPANGELSRRVFLIPRCVAEPKARFDKPTSKTAHERYFRIDEVQRLFATFENNFTLNGNFKSAGLIQKTRARRVCGF